ncbi:Fibronectin type III domain protein [Turneriella parva DSM 21527]|uniref:N-acetylmuramoyl-L-alanine amidase n=2 Tax=Turneriella TaxID=338321 RepID=I4B6M7_TURPD|nr:Fibronectin type III domain protein [Turneriella parva DSM 21527]
MNNLMQQLLVASLAAFFFVACGKNMDKALLEKAPASSGTGGDGSVPLDNGDSGGGGDTTPTPPPGDTGETGGPAVETTTLTDIVPDRIGAEGVYIPSQVAGLRGKTIALGAGHGWRGRTSAESAGARLQRPWVWSSGGFAYSSASTSPVNAFAIVEDYLNSEITHYVLQYLRNAGAEVTLVREQARTRPQVVVCPGAAGYAQTGATFYTSANDSAMAASLCVAGTKYRYVYGDGTGTGKFTYTATVPVSGMYPVYFHYRDGTDRASAIPVTITHAGGTARTYMNQLSRATAADAYGSQGLRYRVAYLGTYYFKTSAAAVVEFQNNFAADKIAAIDTLRLGGGIDTLPIDGTPTNEERYKSSAWQHQKFLGRPSTVARLSSGYNEDVTTRPHAANYEAADAFISVHNNATGSGTYPYSSSSGKGTMVIYQYGTAGSTYKALDEISRSLGLKVKYRMLDHIRAKWDSSWTNITWGDDGFDGDYGETRVASVPAALIEVGFFTHPTELVSLSNEKFYRIAARGIYMGIAEFFSSGYSPEEITGLRVRNTASGEFTLNWQAPATGTAATYYLVRTSKDGVSFDSGRIASTTSATFQNVPAGTVYHFTVQAGNEHGLSLASEVASVRVPVNAADKKLLIVNGFDRLDNRINFVTNYDKRAVGPQVERGNNFNHTPVYSQAVVDSNRPWSIASCANEAVVSGAVLLADYDAVIWYVGRESWSDETFSYAEQQLVAQYLAAGGKLIATGSEIGWDLASQTIGNTHSNDLSFLESTLRTRFAGDDAGTSTLLAGSGALAGVAAFSLDNGLAGGYQNLFPDYYTAVNGSTCVQVYNTASRCAILHYAGTYRLFSLGFPLEIVVGAANRASLIEKMLVNFE